MLKRFLIINSIILLAGAMTLSAVKVRKIKVESFSAFQKGTFRGTLVNNDGQLSLGRDTKAVKAPLVEYYLSIAAKGSDIYVGTGHKAEVYRVNTLNSKSESIASFDEPDVYAVAVASSGTVYAATSPNGKIYSVDSKGKKKVFFDPQEKFIWALKLDRFGNVICATGNNGTVYRVTASGKPSRLFVSEDAHLISLFITSDNRILAGSGDKGVLYCIENNKVKVLHDSPFEEVRGICEDAEGNIYIGCTRSISTFINKKKAEEPLFKKSNLKKSKIGNEKAAVYKIAKNGVVEKIWKTEKEYLYDLAYDSSNGKIIAGTGNSGRVYSIDKDGTFDQIYENDSAQVYKLLAHNNTIIQAGNNTASLNIIEKRLKTRGTYLSEVFDLGVKSSVGHIYWENMAGQAVVYVRSGNSSLPDKTWSEWSPPFSDPDKSNTGIKGKRYVQVKVVLTSSNMTVKPVMAGFRLYYVQTNLRPVVSKIEINPDRKPLTIYSPVKLLAPVSKKMNGGVRVVWDAYDYNDDPLLYNLYLKKKKAGRWLKIQSDLKSKKFTIKPDLYDDGIYTLRVEAHDGSVNPSSMAKRHKKDSRYFVLDSTAPVMSNFLYQGGRVKFIARDTTSIVKEVDYSIDGEKWYILFPKDGICDSGKESFDFNLPVKHRKKTVFIRVKDAQKNFKVFQRSL